jgi:2-oxo-4-hydroxy-4-carboxy-5-ureidoimidazoline decarboxylase
MMQRRPFGDADAVFAASAAVAGGLDADDWLEAFAHHPQIGDVEALRVKFAQPQSLSWSRGEQAGVAAAEESLLARLARGNEAYRQRFGYLFIVRAAGRSVAEMVSLLEDRLRNDPADELVIAAAQQLEIAQLRLEKWLQALCPPRDEVP